MNRVLALGGTILFAGLVLTILYGNSQPAGSIKVPITIVAYAPQSVRNVYSDAGFTFTAVGPYVAFNSRAYYAADAGTLTLPRMPDGVVILSVKRNAGGCVDPTSCADGVAVDPAVETVHNCACSPGSACFVANPDGGLLPDGGPQPFPAPTGVTLSAGTFAGAGCVRKACVEIMGQGLSSWPNTCPGGR